MPKKPVPARAVILARWVYEGYPGQDFLGLRPPRENETVAQWLNRCRDELDACGDSLFDFLVRESVEGGEGLVEEGLRVLETVVRDVQSVIDHVTAEHVKSSHARTTCSRKKPGKK